MNSQNINLTLIRHGEVQKEYLSCYNGHNDISLSADGIAQAKELAKRLACEKFDAIYSSDLKRAKQTLEQLPHAKDAIFDARLREKSWGRDEGLSFDEICKKENIHYENFEQFINALDGESVDEFISRVKEFFYTHMPKQNKKNILIITHSGVIKTLLSLHKNISLEDAFSISIPYLSITRIKI